MNFIVILLCFLQLFPLVSFPLRHIKGKENEEQDQDKNKEKTILLSLTHSVIHQ